MALITARQASKCLAITSPRERQDLAALWQRIERRLDSSLPNWRTRIDEFGQVAAVRDRAGGRHWTDAEVFESLLRAILSAATDWSKVELVLPGLRVLFRDFDLCAYAKLGGAELDARFISWFKARRAASQNLRSSLESLIRTAALLCAWSSSQGSAEDYFLTVLSETNGDPKGAAMQIGGYGRQRKLPGLGVPLAAEALRNLGFDLSKPDRHVNRAIGSFGLVSFRNWKDRKGRKAPIASETEMFGVMCAAEAIASAAGKPVSFTDNAIWLLCAKSGLFLSNEELSRLAS